MVSTMIVTNWLGQHAVAEEVSHRLLTMVARVRDRGKLCNGICRGQSVTEADFL